MKRWIGAGLLLGSLVLGACGPMTLAEAERQCFERARLAKQPRGEVTVGASSDGRTAAGLELNLSSDFLLGKDPAAVWASGERGVGVLDMGLLSAAETRNPPLH